MLDKVRLKEQIVQLTRDLVLIESTDERPEERHRCFQLIRNHLEEIPGVELRRLEKNGYESLVVLPDDCTRPEVLFCGHLDVVEHPDPDSYRSVVRDGRIYGPGAGDMKGQLAILVQLMRHLWREHPGLPIGLAITSDEERGGENGVKFLVEEAGIDAGVAVIPDGGSLTEIIVEEKGIIHLRLRAEGEAAHAARPWLGENALERLIESIGGIQRDLFQSPASASDQWHPTCAVTRMSTPNESPNRIPEHAEAVLDIRFVPPLTGDSLLTSIRERLGSGISAEPIVMAEPTHLAPDDDFALITAEVAGKPAKLTQACGGSDGRFFFAKGIPVMLSRPNIGNLHGHDEWIEIESMLDYFEICRRYVLAKTGI